MACGVARESETPISMIEGSPGQRFTKEGVTSWVSWAEGAYL